jgi:hypoxanthine phosphoribosyltransferase
VTISGVDLSSLVGRDIVLMEDIIDTGLTMTHLIPTLTDAGAKSVRVAALLEKRTDRSCGFKAHFVGFSIPDAFVVGCGLDYEEAFREMPHICVINDKGVGHFKGFHGKLAK